MEQAIKNTMKALNVSRPKAINELKRWGYWRESAPAEASQVQPQQQPTPKDWRSITTSWKKLKMAAAVGKPFKADEHPRAPDGEFAKKDGGDDSKSDDSNNDDDDKPKDDKPKDVWGSHSSDEKSDSMWLKTTASSKISEQQKKELDDTWRSIPKKFTDGISTLKLMPKSNFIVAGGKYFSGNSQLNMTVAGPGVSSVLHHEVHHHMWWKKRMPEQLSKWTTGAEKIMAETGLSPTKYSDSYGKISGGAKLKKVDSEIDKYWAAFDTGSFTIEQCIPEYKEKEKKLKAHKRWLEKANRSIDDDDTVRRWELELKLAKDRFNRYDYDEKKQMADQRFKLLEEARYITADKAKRKEIFYNESHSETGSYIHAEKAMRERASKYNPERPKWDHRINEEVIDKYVALYKEVFD